MRVFLLYMTLTRGLSLATASLELANFHPEKRQTMLASYIMESPDNITQCHSPTSRVLHPCLSKACATQAKEHLTLFMPKMLQFCTLYIGCITGPGRSKAG